jgi:YHS domain-containing protein
MGALIERLISLFFLVLVIRSALQFVYRIFRGSHAGTNAARSASRSRQDPPHQNPPVSTVLHQDPVCGTYVAADASLKRIVDGKVFHFCSEECRDRYAG